MLFEPAANGGRPRRVGVMLIMSLTLTGGLLAGCSQGVPSCTDTNASASRLTNGCKRDGKVYPSFATACADHRTLYNVPDEGPGGGSSSGWSDGKIRTHAATTDEVAACLGQ